MEKGLVSDIQKFSIHDGPGIRTVVFLKGCPLKCLWCSNPETQKKEPEIMFSKELCLKCQRCVDICDINAIRKNNFSAERIDRDLCIGCGKCVEVCPSRALNLRGKWMTVDEVILEVEKDIQFYRSSGGGITVSGGEPFSQIRFLEKLLKECKKRNIHTAIETTGFSKWEEIDRVLDYVDLFLYDIKIINTGEHFSATAVSNEIIIDNLEKLVKRKMNVIIRMPLIPKLTAQKENVTEIAELAKKLGISEMHILPYHNFGERKYKKLGKEYLLHDLEILKEDQVEEFRSLIIGYGLEVSVGG